MRSYRHDFGCHSESRRGDHFSCVKQVNARPVCRSSRGSRRGHREPGRGCRAHPAHRDGAEAVDVVAGGQPGLVELIIADRGRRQHPA
jgi:hypothetical protein